jgi:uncharacterized membrane protein HdeD (DUF308 family)
MGSAYVLSWWALAIRGLAGILLGIAAFVLTGITLAVLVAVFAAYLFVHGAFALVAGIRARSWLLGIEGLVGILAGIATVLVPGLTLLVLAIIVAAWAIFTGILELAAARSLRRVIGGSAWLLAIAGIVSIVFGLMMAIFPGAGIVAVVWVIGAYALVWGALSLALAFRFRGRRAVLVVSGS